MLKRGLVVFVLSLSIGFLLVSWIAFASQTTITTYYPSPSGNYTKVQLTSQGGSGVVCNGSNAGTVFADPTTGFLEICKNDGSQASFPGACFNRYSNTSPAVSAACPDRYQLLNGSTGISSFSAAGNTVYSWACCFNSQGPGGTALPAKSGCFSIYSTGSAPPACTSQDTNNVYDMGCDTIDTSDITTPVYKRNCCYNYTLGGPVNSAALPCCTPNCNGANCGDSDHCGGLCQGNCSVSGQTCGGGGTPFVCGSPACNCGTAVCGEDSCGIVDGANACGICGVGYQCVSGACVPNPPSGNCNGKVCGDSDGAGGICTACPAGKECTTSAPYQCVCAPVCTKPNGTPKACGARDGCGGRCSSGSCPNGLTCSAYTLNVCGLDVNPGVSGPLSATNGVAGDGGGGSGGGK